MAKGKGSKTKKKIFFSKKKKEKTLHIFFCAILFRLPFFKIDRNLPPSLALQPTWPPPPPSLLLPPEDSLKTLGTSKTTSRGPKERHLRKDQTTFHRSCFALFIKTWQSDFFFLLLSLPTRRRNKHTHTHTDPARERQKIMYTAASSIVLINCIAC